MAERSDAEAIAEIRTRIEAVRSDLALIRTRVDGMPSVLHWMVLGAAWFVLMVAL